MRACEPPRPLPSPPGRSSCPRYASTPSRSLAHSPLRFAPNRAPPPRRLGCRYVPCLYSIVCFILLFAHQFFLLFHCRYVPCAIVATHLQCATSRAIRPRYPHDALRFNTQRTVNENIVRALIDSRSLKLTASSSRSVWRNATDMISPLLDIVAPANLAKSTRSNLLSADEKRELRTTAKVMADAGLTYAKADAASVRGWKNRAVLQQYVLEPAIDGLVGFHEQIHAARVEEAERAQKFANRRSKFDAPPR